MVQSKTVKIMQMKKLILLFIFLQASAFALNAQTIVEAHGRLHVDKNRIKDECGRIVQLKGMSFFWHQWNHSQEYWNDDVVNWLRDDWKVQMVRGPVGLADSIGYLKDSIIPLKATERLIEAAVKEGIYVIVDWHTDEIHTKAAKNFFDYISKKYGKYPNVIYEIFNEPDYETWSEVKVYAREIIATIRKNDPDNIIVVGNPHWDQDIRKVADDPITKDSEGNQVSNIAYTVHFYAGAHKQPLRNDTQYALDKGICVFITECGRTGTDWGPGNIVNDDEWNKWMAFADKNHLSWNKWSLSIKNEVCSSLKASASIKGGWDIQKDLTDEGRLLRSYLRSHNTISKKCEAIGR